MDPHPPLSKKAKREKKQKIREAIELSIKNKDKDNKPKFFYLRNEDTKEPIVTVCEVGYEGKKYRGIAICSAMDNPRKSTGRAIALERAIATILLEQNQFPVRREDAINGLEYVNINTEFYYDEEEFFKGQIEPFDIVEGEDIIINCFNSTSYKKKKK